MLPRLERLPRPQQSALGVAFGLQEGDAPNRFLVGLAVLTLLADAAEEQPLLCLVDDAQWPDQVSLQCLAFAARRSMAEPIALVFAERDTSDESELADLPELSVEGLGDHEARLLLATAVRGRLDAQVQDRIIAETRGSPLALAFSLRRGSDAPPLLLKAAKRLEPLDPELARETYLEALGAAIFASRLNRGIGEVGVAQSALGAPPGPQPPRTVDLLLDGLATQFTEGYAAGVPQLQRALHALRQGAERGEDAMHWLWLACRSVGRRDME